MKMQLFEFSNLEKLDAARRFIEANYPNIVAQTTSISDVCTLSVELVNSLMFDTRIKGIIASYGGVAVDGT